MVYTRRTILTVGGVVVLGGVAGCTSVVPNSNSESLAYIDVANKSPTEQTITLTARRVKNADSYLWKDKFTLRSGETREAIRDGQRDHTVPANQTYHIEHLIADDSPTAAVGVVPWQDATGTMTIDVYEDRVASRIEEDS